MSNPVASPFITQLGSFSDMAAEFGTPMFVFASTVVGFLIGYDWINNKISTVIMLYIGDVALLMSSLTCAAYMAYFAVEYVISFVDGLAHMYRRGSIVGNYMGQYEFLYASLYFGTYIGMILMAFYGAVHVWDTIAEREKAVATEGFFGSAVSYRDMIKALTLGWAVLVVDIMVAWSNVQNTSKLISWFDFWSDLKESEGVDKNDSSITDIAGTSIMIDLQYHAVTTIFSWFVETFMLVAVYAFAFNFFQFKRLEDCNLDDVNESYYEPVRPLIASQVDLASCKASVKSIFKLADLDNTQTISRCENAKFLYGMGNTSEYALKYSEEKILPQFYQSCEARFPKYMEKDSKDDE